MKEKLQTRSNGQVSPNKGGFGLKYGSLLALMTAGITLIQIHMPVAQAAPKTQFSIVYSNDVMGEVEPCG